MGMNFKIVIPCDGSRNAFRMQDSLLNNGIPAFAILMRTLFFTEMKLRWLGNADETEFHVLDCMD